MTISTEKYNKYPLFIKIHILPDHHSHPIRDCLEIILRLILLELFHVIMPFVQVA